MRELFWKCFALRAYSCMICAPIVIMWQIISIGVMEVLAAILIITRPEGMCCCTLNPRKYCLAKLNFIFAHSLCLMQLPSRDGAQYHLCRVRTLTNYILVHSHSHLFLSVFVSLYCYFCFCIFTGASRVCI